MRPKFDFASLPRKIALFVGLAALGCSIAERAMASSPINIVTTTAQIADMIEAIGGEQVEVTALMGEAVDPHTYRQTRRDIALLRGADLIVANGLYLEAQLEPILETLAESQNVIALGGLLDDQHYLSHSTYTGKFDPHIWMDVRLWRDSATALAENMAVLWPEKSETFQQGVETYARQLEELDAYVRQSVATIPASARVLITAHDAFQYFARAYDMQVEGIQGLSTESEAGLQRIEELVELIVDRRIHAVFVESSVADRNIKALIEGASARQHAVTIGGSLYSDAMGAPETYEGTYIGMIDHNATTIVRALGGEAPERGWQGRLAGES